MTGNFLHVGNTAVVDFLPIGFLDRERNRMVGIILCVCRQLQKLFLFHAIGMDFTYRKRSFGQSASLIKDYNFGMSQRFQIVAALYENTNPGSTADTAKEAKRDGNDQRTRTGNNQESQGSVNPDAKRLPSNKRRQDCQRKGGKHHRRRVVTGKACNKVLGFSFFIACIFNQVKDFRYGGFPKLFCCLDSQDTSLVDAAADDLHSRFHLTRHGFACEGGCIQSGRTFDDGSIQRDTFTRLYYDNRTDLNFVRVNLHQFAVLFDVRIVRSNIHQAGNRFSGFGNRIRLEPFSNLIEQHNGDTL